MTERDVEVPWAIDNATGTVLDVGCAESEYLKDVRDNGQVNQVDGIDVRYIQPVGVDGFYLGDIRHIVFPHRYDTVLAISTIEHVGLNAYDMAADDPDGDRHALEGCVRACKASGRVLVSVPFGRPHDYGWFRQYDLAGLDRLFDGFDRTTEVWEHTTGHWVKADVPDETREYGPGMANAVALVDVRC